MTSLQFAQFRLGSAMHNLRIPDNLIVSRVFSRRCRFGGLFRYASQASGLSLLRASHARSAGGPTEKITKQLAQKLKHQTLNPLTSLEPKWLQRV